MPNSADFHAGETVTSDGDIAEVISVGETGLFVKLQNGDEEHWEYDAIDERIDD